MDNRPIGVFDSGLGGLTAVRRLSEVLPGEDIIYLGDTGRVPYGGRSRETIVKYAREDMKFLLGFNIKAVVVACGTVSTVAMPVIEPELDLPVFGVVKPAALKAARLTANRRVGLIATKASVKSGAYEKEIRRLDPSCAVLSKACPLFVPLVENGRIEKGDTVIETVAAEYLKEVADFGADTLILGCTHYPLLMNVISDIMGNDVTLVDPGAETAEYLASELMLRGMLAEKTAPGLCRCFVTDSTDDFYASAELFLGRGIISEVEQVEL
ncbi:MAG: glutamate racemase [Clostridiales bacterium]|jgi:glutamate racemase|nr:glutamate racemase [Clostridiales bacterium]